MAAGEPLTPTSTPTCRVFPDRVVEHWLPVSASPNDDTARAGVGSGFRHQAPAVRVAHLVLRPGSHRAAPTASAATTSLAVSFPVRPSRGTTAVAEGPAPAWAPRARPAPAQSGPRPGSRPHDVAQGGSLSCGPVIPPP